MKIILQKEVDKLGAPGDVVQVADGYARNYLIPRGLATTASRGAEKHAERLRKAHDLRMQKGRLDAEALGATMSRSPLRIEARAGEDGRLFGSVTAADVARELEQRVGQPVDRRDVHLAEPIRNVGAHEVSVHLHADVEVAVTVEVVAQ